MKRFKFISSPLNDVVICERNFASHELGFFVRFFCSEEFKSIGFNKPIIQMNQTLTKVKGSIRGMHFQRTPYAEKKIITCLKGVVFDVVVDIRKGSPTFLQWHGEILSHKNNKSICIPEGIAHGFQALTNDCEMFYLHTAPYVPESEGALNWNDPLLSIKWPLPATEISARDNNHDFISKKFNGLVV